MPRDIVAVSLTVEMVSLDLRAALGLLCKCSLNINLHL